MQNLNIIQTSNIVRCRYCRTYINPYVVFPDSRHWRCNLCGRSNDRRLFFLLTSIFISLKITEKWRNFSKLLIKSKLVVPDDFSWDPVRKAFGDPTNRPEIQNATVEYIAPNEYMVGEFRNFYILQKIKPF